MTHLLDTAISIASVAHFNQTDLSGKPYILHPLRVMLSMETDVEKLVAVMHDVIEDSRYPIEGMKHFGFPTSVINALIAITKEENELYGSFIERVGKNKIATRVKMKDIEDNLNALRVCSLNSLGIGRIKNYYRAWRVLNEKLN